MSIKSHFCEQRQRLRLHIEQLRVVKEDLSRKHRSTDKVDMQIAREQRQLDILEEIWDIA